MLKKVALQNTVGLVAVALNTRMVAEMLLPQAAQPTAPPICELFAKRTGITNNKH